MLLRDTWPEKGLFGRVGRELNTIARILNGAVGFDGAQVFVERSGLQVYGGGRGVDLSLFNFGVSGMDIDSGTPVLKLNSGIITTGVRRTAVQESQISLHGHPAFVILKISRKDGIGAWEPALSTIPGNTASHWFIPFYEYHLTSTGEYELVRVHRLGNVEAL